MATPGAIGAKRLTALRSVSSSVQRLAEILDLDQTVVDALNVQPHSDPKIREVRYLEAIDYIMSQVTIKAQALDQGQVDRSTVAAAVLDLEGLTKTSRQVIQEWAKEA